MHRLSIILTSIFSVLLLASASKSSPNILYILADDLGYADVGYQGQRIIKTPNIDQLAASGMRFSQHYSGSTVCAPSRSCLLTGQHTGQTYVRANQDIQLRKDPLDMTVASYLKQAGYATGMIGKASTGCICKPGNPADNGFDYFFGFLTHRGAHRYFPEKMYRNGEAIQYPDNKGKNGETYSQDILLKEVLGFIESEKKGPFFLHYSMQLPHAGLWAEERFKAPYRGIWKEVPNAKNAHYRYEEEPVATMAGMIARADWEIGQILLKLEDLGILENTVIFFASDNGPHSAGGHNAELFNGNGMLRGEKRDLYEGGIRVPHVVSWKGVVQAGSSSNHVSAFWDFLPTACEIAGIPVPENINGISYLPTLLGNSEEQAIHEYLYWEFYEQGGKRATRFGDWKAVQLFMDKGGYAIELYNLDKDVRERYNIASNHPDIVAQAEAIFKDAHVPSPVVSWGNQ